MAQETTQGGAKGSKGKDRRIKEGQGRDRTDPRVWCMFKARRDVNTWRYLCFARVCPEATVLKLDLFINARKIPFFETELMESILFFS